MDHVSHILRVFASCVAAAIAAFTAWYATYAIMWLLTWLIAALAALAVAWLAYGYVNAKLGNAQLGDLGATRIVASVRGGYDRVLSHFFASPQAAQE